MRSGHLATITALAVIAPGCIDVGGLVFDRDSPQSCGMFADPAASTLVTDFAQDPAPGWIRNGDCATQQNGELVITLPPGMPSDYCKYDTAVDYHLNCDQIRVKVTAVATLELHVQTAIYVVSASDPTAKITLFLEAGGFGGYDNVTDGSYDPQADLWWGVREQSGTLYFDTSRDGETWHNKASTPATFPVDSVQIQLGAGYYAAPATDPGQARFDCYDVAPGACP